MSANLAHALLDALDDDAMDALAERLAPRLATPAPEPWLTVEQAAAHLAISTSQLYSLTAQRHRNGLPVTAEGSRRYFRASELDRWRTHNTNGGL
jgi:excisionase family DNA binding protein